MLIRQLIDFYTRLSQGLIFLQSTAVCLSSSIVTWGKGRKRMRKRRGKKKGKKERGRKEGGKEKRSKVEGREGRRERGRG
jgi:hypothetical protein